MTGLPSKGGINPFEQWVDGVERAYTPSALAALRIAKEETRERYSCKVELLNGFPYFVGPSGYGDFFIGDRIAVHAKGMPENKLFIEQVEELEFTSSADEHGWNITVGQPEFTTAMRFLSERYEALTEGLRDQGVW
jgi:hypothetical protein